MWGQRPVGADVTALGGERAGCGQAGPPGPMPILEREGLELGLCCRFPEGQAGLRPMLSGLLKHKAVQIN